jgi:hypothetical protein
LSIIGEWHKADNPLRPLNLPWSGNPNALAKLAARLVFPVEKSALTPSRQRLEVLAWFMAGLGYERAGS